MTRSVFLVNMSNFQDEDYEIIVDGFDPEIIAPGGQINLEDVRFGAYAQPKTIHVIPVKNDKVDDGYDPPSLPDGMEEGPWPKDRGTT